MWPARRAASAYTGWTGRLETEIALYAETERPLEGLKLAHANRPEFRDAHAKILTKGV